MFDPRRVGLAGDRIEEEVGVREVRGRGRVLGVLETADQRLDGVAIGVEAVIRERPTTGQALEALRDEARVVRGGGIDRRPPIGPDGSRCARCSGRFVQVPSALRVATYVLSTFEWAPSCDEARRTKCGCRPPRSTAEAARYVRCPRGSRARTSAHRGGAASAVATPSEASAATARARPSADAKKQHESDRENPGCQAYISPIRPALPGHSSLDTAAFLAVARRNINTPFYVVKRTRRNQRGEASPTSRSRAISVQRSDFNPSATALPRIGQTGQK